MADPKHLQSNVFAQFGANTSQWQIEGTVTAKVALRSKKSCSPKSAHSTGTRGTFFFRAWCRCHLLLLYKPPWRPLRMGCAVTLATSGKWFRLKQLKLGIRQPGVQLQQTTGWTWCVWTFFFLFVFSHLPTKRPKKLSSRAAFSFIETGKWNSAHREADAFGSAWSKRCREIPVPVTLWHYAPAGAGAFPRQFWSTCSLRDQHALRQSLATAPYLPLEFKMSKEWGSVWQKLHALALKIASCSCVWGYVHVLHIGTNEKHMEQSYMPLVWTWFMRRKCPIYFLLSLLLLLSLGKIIAI